jgi:cytidylate kinase
MSFSSVIAIDGPSGSGKSTVAKALAQKLDIVYIDTGAMFRALAYSADKENVDLTNEAAVQNFLESINLEYQSDDNSLIKANGEDLTDKIREHHVSKLASIISQIPAVRTFLLNFQRDLAKEKTCVMEGRDIGSVVFPDAFCKFFVTASIEVRAKRRFDQLMESGQDNVDLEQLMADVKKRDDKDSQRDVAPLKVAEDADLIDTSEMGLDDVISNLSNMVKTKASEVGISL